MATAEAADTRVGDRDRAADERLNALLNAYAQHPRPLALHCGVQHYGWGDHQFIPELLGQRAPSAQPQAELWIGAHPDLPSLAAMGEAQVPLDQLIAAAPTAVLGTETAARFGPELPFLFKVLAAATPLSIQAHPNRAEALRGFEREAAAGISPTDPRRNYRDRNHKPELLLALTDFHALRGFRPLDEIDRELTHYPALAELRALLDGTPKGLRNLYECFMRLPQPEVDAMLAPVLKRCRARAEDPTDPGRTRCRWLLRADSLFLHDAHHDRGLLSFLLLNLLHLRPGQAIFLPAGELHSYLAGAGLELMANSNNVLRGGLTPKHIDVDALLEVLHVDPHAPEILTPTPLPDTPEMLGYQLPAIEFALHRLRLDDTVPRALRPSAVTLGLVLDGALELTAADTALILRKGKAFLLPAATQVWLAASSSADVTLASIGCQGDAD